MNLVAKTDIGHQRSENQDNYRAGRQPDDTVWALVCDGMGGARGGKQASSLAAEYMEQAFLNNIDTLASGSPVRNFLFEAVDGANALIYRKAQEDPAVRGMGTTIVCAVLRGDRIQYAHAGDSRIYLYRERKIFQLTKDHSMVQELLEQGTISEEEAQSHPNKNLITRALGVSANIDVDYGETELHQGDILLLCTDGLSNYLTQEQIAKVLEETPFYETVDVLVQQALDAGGLDNITVLLVQAEPAEG